MSGSVNAKDVTSGTGTGAEGHEAATDDLSGQRGAFPAVWWSKSAGEWFHDDPVHGLMAVGAIGSLADSLPRDAQRLVPVGPLLELVRRWRKARDELTGTGEPLAAEALDRAAQRLASLLGESPESPVRQEGNDD